MDFFRHPCLGWTFFFSNKIINFYNCNPKSYGSTLTNSNNNLFFHNNKEKGREEKKKTNCPKVPIWHLIQLCTVRDEKKFFPHLSYNLCIVQWGKNTLGFKVLPLSIPPVPWDYFLLHLLFLQAAVFFSKELNDILVLSSFWEL